MCHATSRRLRFVLTLVGLFLAGYASALAAAPSPASSTTAATPTPTPTASVRDSVDQVVQDVVTPTAAVGDEVDQVVEEDLPTPAATEGATPTPLDSDGDGVLDRVDNCPLTPNPEQPDTNGNGLGDPCDAPFAGGFAYVTPDGVVQTRVDNRLRLVQILAPNGRVLLVWSDDASHVELTAQVNGESSTWAFEVDLGDSALLKALDGAEAATGQDLTALRTWVRDNPGRVLAVARGEQPPPLRLPDATSSLPRYARLASIPLFQDQLPHVRVYLDALVLQAGVTWTAWNNFDLAHPEPGAAVARNLLLDTTNEVDSIVNEELRTCSPCSVFCHIDCGAGEGACFTHDPDPLPCYENLEQDCGAIGGVFYLGQECPGACWLFSGGKSGCWPLMERDCVEIPKRSKESGGEGNIDSRFCRGRTCRQPACNP